MNGDLVQNENVEHVCIRAPNWVGDAVMATPTFRAVRQALPRARVTLVVRQSVEAVLRAAPWFDETIVYRPGGLAAGEFLRCTGRLRRPRRALGLVLPNSFSSALMFRLAGVRRRVGYPRDTRSFLLTDPVPRPSENGRFKPTYMVDYYLALCAQAGRRGRAADGAVLLRRGHGARTRHPHPARAWTWGRRSS